MQELIGGRYRTSARLGAGGMGTVYAATDTVTGSYVAVKVVSAEIAENDVALGRFEREVRAVRTLETPHVVRMLDAGRDVSSGLPFLVMEVLEGDDAAYIFKRIKPLRPDVVLRLGAQACAGLEIAHAARIVHRDIKPSNLFFTIGPAAGQRTIKILDFGLAKLMPQPESSPEPITNLTKTGHLLGSPLYMAPEQARGQKNIDARVDIFSLGVVLYEALTGRTPHPYTDALGELIVTICTEPAERIEHLAPWVPKQVADIVHRALEINPAARFQSISEMRSALLSCLSDDTIIYENMLVTIPESERTTLSISTNTPQPVQIVPVAKQEVLAPASTTDVMRRPHPGYLVAAVLAFAALGGVLSFLLFRKPASTKIETTPSAMQSTNLAPPTRIVRVNVDPATAKVTVNGEPVSMQDGTITIEGALGSAHTVRVTTDNGSETTNVIIAEQGASPDRVTVAPIVSTTAITTAKRVPGAPRPPPTGKPPPTGTIYLGR